MLSFSIIILMNLKRKRHDSPIRLSCTISLSQMIILIERERNYIGF